VKTLQKYEYNQSKKEKEELQKKIEELNSCDNFVLTNSTKT
jgi:hypothetical protein